MREGLAVGVSKVVLPNVKAVCSVFDALYNYYKEMKSWKPFKVDSTRSGYSTHKFHFGHIARAL